MLDEIVWWNASKLDLYLMPWSPGLCGPYSMKNMTNSKAFPLTISSNINLLFLKSVKHPRCFMWTTSRQSIGRLKMIKIVYGDYLSWWVMTLMNQMSIEIRSFSFPLYALCVYYIPCKPSKKEPSLYLDAIRLSEIYH